MIDEQLFEMLNDRFNRIETMLGEAKASFDAHVTKDEGYWKKLDAQDAQFNILKWIVGPISGTSFLAWLYEHFHR